MSEIIFSLYMSPNKNMFSARRMLQYVLDHDRVTLLSYLMSLRIPNESPLQLFQDALMNHTDYAPLVDDVVTQNEIDAFFREYIANKTRTKTALYKKSKTY